MKSIIWGREKLNITTPLVYSSNFEIKSKGSQRLVDICQELKATEYISGEGGKDYLDEKIFNCKVTYFKPNISNYYSIINNVM